MEHELSYLVVLCCLLIHVTFIGFDSVVYHTAWPLTILVYCLSQAVAYLLYPVLGYVADVHFTRYKFVLFSFVTVIVASVMIIIGSVFLITNNGGLPLTLFAGLAVAVNLIGMGFFESTAIQFGMDQMLEASSDQLSRFIHWYYWSSNIGPAVFFLLEVGTFGFFSLCTRNLQSLHPQNLLSSESTHVVYCTVLFIIASLQLVCTCVGLCLLVYYKKHFNIDRTGEHPLKLIYQVLKYAWKHKCPENRSAFTYWEEDIPPRIDLGKSKYGGPFTTEEVEDTKTFFSILLLLLSMIGFHLSGHGYSVSSNLMKTQCPTHWIIMLLGDPLHITFLTTIIGVPLYQLFRKYFTKQDPSMITKMGLGLFCCLVKGAATLEIQLTMTKNEPCKHFDNNTIDACFFLTCEFNAFNVCTTISNVTNGYFSCPLDNTAFFVLLIPNILQGLAYILVFMTALEFICAQAPLRLKGLLIGIWYSLLAINYLLVKLPDFFIINYNTVWIIFQEVKAFIIFLSLMIFLCVSRRYRYRVRDEVVNEQFLVEEIYERELARAAESDDDNSDETSVLVESAQEQGPCYNATGSMRCRDH